MTQELVVEFHLRGGNREAYDAREREILVEGPRGTGKTRTILELLNNLCHTYPGLAALIVRKTQRTLASTCLRTFNEQVLTNGDGVSFFGGNETEPASYRYPNGSRIVVGGMDNSEKVKSSEYSIIYVNEATDLTEDDWEALTVLLRQAINGQPGLKAQRIIGDCNPSHSGHWLNLRCEAGKTRRIVTVLKDNPFFYNTDGTPTLAGQAYIDTLESLTGPRRERWLEGKWTGVENAAYPAFDRDVHIQPLEPGLLFRESVMGVDYGLRHESAIVVISIDQWNRRWVREAWSAADDDKGKTLNLQIQRLRTRYRVKRGRVDPNQHVLGNQESFEVAERNRFARIDLLEPLFYMFPGGRVPSYKQIQRGWAPEGHYAEPDSPGIILVEGMPGIDKLAQQIEGYHYIWKESDTGKRKEIVREDDDLVAALEDANEEWEVGKGKATFPVAVQNPTRGRTPSAPSIFGKRRTSAGYKEFNSI